MKELEMKRLQFFMTTLFLHLQSLYNNYPKIEREMLRDGDPLELFTTPDYQ